MKIHAYLMSLAFALAGGAAPLAAQTGNLAPGKPEVKQIRDNRVSLEWSNVEPVYGIFDDFEEHEDFAINSPGKVGWSYLDMDNDKTYVIGNYIYRNSGAPMAFQVWVPSKTVPAYTNKKGLPHKGNKCLVSMATIGNKRNDWLISPDLTSYHFAEDFTLSFWARSMTASYGIEKVKIGYSTTNKDISSFTFLNNGEAVEIPESSAAHPEMYYFSFSIPKEARYVAINCVTDGDGGQALFIDELAIASNKVMPNKAGENFLTGFNVYRDGVKVNRSPVLEHSYTDTVTVFGEHDYQIEAVYQSGEPAKGEALRVNVPNIHLLPFVETFYTYSFETNFWEVSCPGTESCYWSVNYREGGLVDAAAEFKPRAGLENYTGYCITSMEFDATALSGVMISYDIALQAYTGAMPTGQDRTEEKLWLEVSTDNGRQWQRVRKHNNAKGSFGYDRIYIDLSDKVAGKKFKIRFNAEGGWAFCISAWYISYVKVYEKAKATVAGTVKCGNNPVEGMNLTITSQDEDIYTATTAADGTYSMADVDAGRYVVSGIKTGYNPYTDTVDIEKGSKTLDLAVTKPEISMASATGTHTLAAEATQDGAVNLSNTGNGSARVGVWVNYNQKQVEAEPSFEILGSFNTSEIMQASICFDGTYFYLAQDNEFSDAIIHKYDRNFSHIGSFMPDINVRRYFGMAFDGLNFYTANGDSIIRVFDFDNESKIGEIPTQISDICHIAYDEQRDAFWVGALNTLALVDREGNTLVNEVIYNSEEVMFSGAAYDPYFKEGPCLWIMDRSRANHALSAFTKAVIRRIDLGDMKLKTDYSYNCDQLPDFPYGGDVIQGFATGEGLFGTTRYKDGHFVLMGVVVSSPGIVGIWDMYEVSNWLKVEDYAFGMDKSSNKTLAYTVDAAQMLDGQEHNATVRFRFDPYIEPLDFGVSVNVTGKAANARPLALRAEAKGDTAAVLTWTAPSCATAPTRYIIYRNGVKIDSVTTLTYTDGNLKNGTYMYAVSARYGTAESALSQEAKVQIELGVACYAPFGLKAVNRLNSHIDLTWQDPSSMGKSAMVLRHGNGVKATGIYGMEEPFVAAVAWSAIDLTDYRDMKLASVSFVPMTKLASYTLKIYENDVEVHSQAVAADAITVGKAMAVALGKDYKINNRKNLKVGVQIKMQEGVDEMCIGVDAGPVVRGKGDLIYMAGYGWFTLTQIGNTSANFNIALNLEPKTGTEALAQGFNVYRDGVKLNSSPVTECRYTDDIEVAGRYSYTVTALHPSGESYPSQAATAQIVDIAVYPVPDGLTASVSRNRYVSLYWNNPDMAASNSKSDYEYRPFAYISDFELGNPSESGVATDGEYIYTTHWNRNGEFHKYTLSGEFVEDFTIPGVSNLFDLAYDGRYFYGSGNSTNLYCLDLENKTLVSTISTTVNIRHCAYIPELDNGKGGFEVGEWTTSYFISKSGAFLGNGYQGLDGAYGAAYHDGKLYYSQQGAGGLVEIMEVDFNTLTATGNRTDLSTNGRLSLENGSRACGLASRTTSDGSLELLVNVQRPDANNKIVFLEGSRNAYVSSYNIYRDGRKVNNQVVETRHYVDTVAEYGEYTYTVAAVYVDEQESAKSQGVKVQIVEPTYCQAPVNVRVNAKNRDVSLQWNTVLEQQWRGDSMESYTHLATGTVGNWITIDGDGRPVYSSEDFSFSGMDQARTFFVLDQSQIDAPSKQYAFSGNKSFVALAAYNSDNSVETDDWLIGEAKTAENTTPSWISFMARGLDAGSKEYFYVAYSTMGSDTSHFIQLGSFTERVDYLWTRFTYTLPENVKYVAIHYVSLDGKALFIDDVCMGTGECPFTVGSDFGAGETMTEAVEGYYVYRDGELVTPDMIKSSSFFDGNLANGEYTYTVKAVYNTSCESSLSDPVKVKVDYASPCFPPESFTAQANGKDVELQWMRPLYDEPAELTYVKSIDVAGACGWTTASTYYVANKWEPADLMGVFGFRITAVMGYFYEAPTKLDLLIYQGGQIVYEQDVTRECNSIESPSLFMLNEPYQIDFSKDLMVGFRIAAEDNVMTMLYTSGRADNGYGNLYSDDGKNWFSAYTYSAGQWKGNWFMIVGMELPMAQDNADFLGYRVYRDDKPLMEAPIEELSYSDKNLESGTYNYQVAAVYTSCGEAFSEGVKVRIGVGNEFEKELDFAIWPNPAHGTVSIRGEYEKLEIVDLQGKVRIVRNAGTDGTLDISALHAGVYFVRVKTSAGTIVKKLMVW